VRDQLLSADHHQLLTSTVTSSTVIRDDDPPAWHRFIVLVGRCRVLGLHQLSSSQLYVTTAVRDHPHVGLVPREGTRSTDRRTDWWTLDM